MSHSNDRPPRQSPLHSAPHSIYYRPNADGAIRPVHSEPAIDPTTESVDSLQDWICELKRAGKWEDIVEHIRASFAHAQLGDRESHRETIRALVVEFQGDNPQLTVDAFSYATGLNVFGAYTLRDYAKRNGVTPEGFRKRVLELRRRFHLNLSHCDNLAA